MAWKRSIQPVRNAYAANLRRRDLMEMVKASSDLRMPPRPGTESRMMHVTGGLLGGSTFLRARRRESSTSCRPPPGGWESVRD